MTDGGLEGLLGSLRTERMDRIADDKIRARLENAWTSRQRQRSFGFRARRLAPVLATGVLCIGLGTATMSAPGESALYGWRVAIEDAAIALHTDAEDRAEYLLGLIDQRQAEAARLEAIGNAAAASRARDIEENTVRIARAMLPQAPELPAPVAAASESPTPSPSVTPSPAPTATPSVVPSTAPTNAPTARPTTPRPAVTPTKTPTPTATPTKTPTPTLTPTGTSFLVQASGYVKNSDATPASGVCVRLFSSTASCTIITGADGTYRVSFSGKINQQFTIYLTRQDGTTLWKGSATMTIKSSTVQMPDVKLVKG